MDIAERLVVSARSWVGVRYCHRGGDRRGVDCFGLVRAVYAESMGVFPVRWPEYGSPEQRAAHSGLGISILAQHFAPARLNSPASLMVFELLPKRYWHLGFSTGTGFIHAHSKYGVIEEPVPEIYRRRYVTSFDLTRKF